MSLVRPALPAEAPDAVCILAEAAAWASASGACAWSPEEFTLPDYEAIARRGELIGGYRDGSMVACMRLEAHDPVYWPDDPPGSALYVHKLAVSRSDAGKGWSARLIGWAWDEAGRRGVPALKLDTLPEPRLLAHYQGLGFRPFDTEPHPFGPIHVIRMQRTA